MEESNVKTAILSIEYKDMDKIVLTNTNGDTYTSKSEELMDFLYNCDDQSQITKLEVRNKELEEALENICNEGNGSIYDVDDDPDRYILAVDKIALQALNKK